MYMSLQFSQLVCALSWSWHKQQDLAVLQEYDRTDDKCCLCVSVWLVWRVSVCTHTNNNKDRLSVKPWGAHRPEAFLFWQIACVTEASSPLYQCDFACMHPDTTSMKHIFFFFFLHKCDFCFSHRKRRHCARAWCDKLNSAGSQKGVSVRDQLLCSVMSWKVLD